MNFISKYGVHEEFQSKIWKVQGPWTSPLHPARHVITASRGKPCDVLASPIKTPSFQRKTMECPVCLDVIAEGAEHRTTCGHVFHETCMTWWLRRATTCPLCRTTVAEAPTAPDEAPALAGFLAHSRALSEEMRAEISAIRAVLAAQEAAAAAKRLKSAQRSALARAAAKHRMQVALSQMPPHAVAAMEEQRKAKRSAAAKRAAATRAANRMALVTCNG